MYIADSIIHAYLQKQELQTAPDHPLMEHSGIPQSNRQDVVKELLKHLHTFCDTFPVFNAPLWNLMFPAWKESFDHILLLPVVGTFPHGNYVFQKEEQLIIQIDLLYIADFTRILSQMVYIMNNYLTKELALIAIQTAFPYKGTTSEELLDYRTYAYGFANFLSWNESCDAYVFHLDKYEEKKIRSFSALYQLACSQDQKLKKFFLTRLSQIDFWEQFPDIAGMFYLNDIYREQGIDGLLKVYHNGYPDFVSHIFCPPSS